MPSKHQRPVRVAEPAVVVVNLQTVPDRYWLFEAGESCRSNHLRLDRQASGPGWAGCYGSGLLRKAALQPPETTKRGKVTHCSKNERDTKLSGPVTGSGGTASRR